MTTDDEVLRLFERADPALPETGLPVLDALAYLDALEVRSTDAGSIELERDSSEPLRQRRWLVAAAAAAVFLLVGGLVVGAATDEATRVEPAGSGSTSTTVPEPSNQRVGYLGLPPDGASPSTPETGELVASWFLAPYNHISGVSWYGARYLYADGRMVSMRSGPIPGPDFSTGWFEQRLSPEGVDLIQTEILSTGLFDADVPPPNDAQGDIEVRDGDRLVQISVDSSGAPTDLDLLKHLADLETWLPDRVWESREMTAYVPSRYAVCLTGGGADDQTELADAGSVVALLPVRAHELLGSATQPTGVAVNCSEMTTQEARELVSVLGAAGLDSESWSLGLRYSFDTSAFGFEAGDISPDAVSATVGIQFYPLQPDGTPSIMAGS